MVLTLYVDYLSEPCRALIMFCKANKIPIVEKVIDLQSGEHKKPQFLLINPMGQVPALKDNTFLLSESVAIAKYLASKHEVDDHWYPSNLEERARVDQFLAWHHHNLRGKTIKIFLDEVFSPLVLGKKVEASVLEEDLTNLKKTLDYLQTHILRDQEFLCGNDVSLADLFAICEIMQTNLSGRDVLKDYPKLRQWFDLVRVTMSPLFEEVHGRIYELRDRVIASSKEEKREEKVKEMREIRRRESTEPEGEVIKLDLDGDLNFKPETEEKKENGTIEEKKENGTAIVENGDAKVDAKANEHEATVKVTDK